MSGSTFRHNYLTISLPDLWEDASQVIALGPEDGGFRPNVVFSDEPTKPGETAIQYAARQLPQLELALTGYTLINERSARFGPNSGFLREHTFSMDKGDIRQFQFYVIISGRAYTLTFTNLNERFESARTTAEMLFANTRIVPRGFLANAGNSAEV